MILSAQRHFPLDRLPLPLCREIGYYLTHDERHNLRQSCRGFRDALKQLDVYVRDSNINDVTVWPEAAAIIVQLVRLTPAILQVVKQLDLAHRVNHISIYLAVDDGDDSDDSDINNFQPELNKALCIQLLTASPQGSAITVHVDCPDSAYEACQLAAILGNHPRVCSFVDYQCRVLRRMPCGFFRCEFFRYSEYCDIFPRSDTVSWWEVDKQPWVRLDGDIYDDEIWCPPFECTSADIRRILETFDGCSIEDFHFCSYDVDIYTDDNDNVVNRLRQQRLRYKCDELGIEYNDSADNQTLYEQILVHNGVDVEKRKLLIEGMRCIRWAS